MASLTGQTIQSTYDSLLKISGNDSLTSSLQRITDGLGNFTPLYLSTTAVEISSGLNVVGSITGSNLSGTNTGDETNSSIKTKLGAASSSQDGYLTSTDWSTFNAKQSALGYTPVPQTRTLTINGTTFDLSADRSWTISTGVTRSQIITALGTGGSPFEFLKSDGSVDTNSYVTFGRTITINGTTFDLSANRSYSVGTVTSVSGTGTVSGLTLTGSVTGSGSLTLGGTLSLTSGQITGGLGYTPVTDARTLTINGTTFDLTANRSWTIASSQWITSGSSIYYNTGTVGIGTTTPDSLLHLESSTVDTRINLNSTSSSLTPYIMFRSLGVNKATIGLGQYTGGSLNNLLLYCDSGDTIFSNNVERMRVINTGQLRLSSYTSTTSFTGTAAGYLAFDSSGNIITTATPSSSQWTTSGSNIFYNTGNVGIGTSSPGQRLVVQDSGDTFIQVRNNTAGQNLFIGALSGEARFNNDNATPMTYWVNGSERMRITSGGDVGIGTTTPNIYGFGGVGRFLTVLNPSGYAVANIISNGTSGGGITIGNETIRRAAIDALNGSDLAIYTNGSNSGTSVNERMRITSGGQLLVGTTNSDIGGTVSGVGVRPSGYVLASNTDTNIFSAPFYSDRRGTNNNGPAYTLAMGGFLKADIGIIGTNSGVDNASITFNTISFNTTRSERVRITSGGSLCVNTAGGPVINNTTLSTRSLTTTATDRVIEGYSVGFSALFYVQNNGSYFFAGSNLSDARTKKDINYLNDSVLDKVMQLKPASFKYIQNDENVKGGFIAQDVKEIFPDLVTKTQSEEDMMGVDYYGVIGILTKAIQELKQEIEELKNK